MQQDILTPLHRRKRSQRHARLLLTQNGVCLSPKPHSWNFDIIYEKYIRILLRNLSWGLGFVGKSGESSSQTLVLLTFHRRYTDSPDEDWLIGSDPVDPSLMLATAGSGHAYKASTTGIHAPMLIKLSSSFRSLAALSRRQFKVHWNHTWLRNLQFIASTTLIDQDLVEGLKNWI